MGIQVNVLNARYRTEKISHHATFTSVKAKLDRLRASNLDPSVYYELRVNQEAAYRPHELWRVTRLADK